MSEETTAQEETTPKKKTAKKAPSKKAPSRMVYFHFPNDMRRAYTFAYNGRPVRIVAENQMIRLNPANAQDKAAIDYLREHKHNRDNGGGTFRELSENELKPTTIAQRIDDLIELNLIQLFDALDRDMQYSKLTKGGMIAVLLGLED